MNPYSKSTVKMFQLPSSPATLVNLLQQTGEISSAAVVYTPSSPTCYAPAFHRKLKSSVNIRGIDKRWIHQSTRIYTHEQIHPPKFDRTAKVARFAPPPVESCGNKLGAENNWTFNQQQQQQQQVRDPRCGCRAFWFWFSFEFVPYELQMAVS